jgi:hypothetical protein
MRGDARAPFLAIPCGHTLCKTCIDKFCGSDAQQCRLCRAKVASFTVNHSLQQLIETFVSSRSKLLEQQLCAAPTQLAGDPARTQSAGTAAGIAVGYSDRLESLHVRLTVLDNERHDAERCATEAEQKAAAFRRAHRALQEEEQQALARLEVAKQALALVRNHLAEQRRGEAEATQLAEQARAREAMVSSSIASLRAERDKVAILLQASRGRQ